MGMQQEAAEALFTRIKEVAETIPNLRQKQGINGPVINGPEGEADILLKLAQAHRALVEHVSTADAWASSSADGFDWTSPVEKEATDE